MPTLSALRCLSGFVRPSRRSLSGWVFVVSFARFPAARACARQFARWLPRRCGGVVVRRGVAGWLVSLPVVL